MARFTRCERCPNEHTKKCENCNTDKQPEEITIEKAIKYFEEENEGYENILGDRVNLLPEYRINQLVIKALILAAGV